MSAVDPTVTVTVTCVAWAVRPGMPSVKPLNMATESSGGLRLGALLQHRRRQRGERGGVGRGIQFRVNLRRPAIVDGGPATEHEDRRDERIRHRDVAAAVTQQAIKTECRHGDGPHICRSPRVWVKKTVRLG